MARQQNEEQESPQAEFNQRIVTVLEQMAENAPVQEIGYGHPKYQERLRQEGVFDTFSNKVFQHGAFQAEARGLRPETIERAPQLRAGTYLGGKVTVSRSQHGAVNLDYPYSSVEDRIRFESLVAPRAKGWTQFDELVDKIWTEMHATVAA